jgi:hypothetical protein
MADPKPIRKPSIKTLRDKADALFSMRIRLRDQREIGHCHLCNKPIQCVSHLFTRSTYALRWDDRASFGSCSGCNCSHEYRPEIYTAWFIKKYGHELYLELESIHHKAEKVGRERIEEIIAMMRGG